MPRTRTALITGASRGIGLCIARSLAARGMQLVLTAREPERLELAAEQLREGGVEIVTVAADLLEDNATEKIIAASVERLDPPTVLVNNAGSAPSCKIEDTSDQLLEGTLTLHVKAPLRLIRAALPYMRENGEGCIVQIASTAGLRGFPFTSAYTAAKHAMVGLTRALAAETRGTGIHTYAVCPGFVDTDLTQTAAEAISARGKSSTEEAIQRLGAMNTIGRMHRPEEVADAVAWLCADKPDGCVYDLDRTTPGFV